LSFAFRFLFFEFSTMALLSVNLNKIATLRNTRALPIPDPVHFGRIALLAGAHGLTIHPRPDHRHIRPDDVTRLSALWKKEFPQKEFNIEGNPFLGDYMKHIRDVRPTQCTLVPDSPEANTSDHGWTLIGPGNDNAKKLAPLIAEMKSLNCRVSLFMDAGISDEELATAKNLGADRIELYTEPYAAAFATPRFKETLAQFVKTARQAATMGLHVNAGHDLNLPNLPSLIQAIPQIAEVSIGHALIADALEFGMHDTIKKYLAACTAP
jgi:pyridoxine 5-phosphate synthase